MGDPLSIQKVIDRLLDGTVRIPGFQRKFVWPPQKAALLMDSFYKQYPVGTILFWRTGQRLKRENRLGVFRLPEPQKDYPIDYVLDGQQRLTSIFMTFQRQLEPIAEDPDVWLPIYYDFDAEEDAQDSRFVALAQEQVDPERHFPLSTFFDPVGFSSAARVLEEKKHNEIAHVQHRFLTALLPVQTFEAEDRASVAIVFERVNRMGIPLDTYQLLTAWTWSDEFDLQKRFEDLAEEIEEFGFNEIGDDSDLMMRCCAAALKHDPSPTSLVDMHGAEVRAQFGTVETAIKRSVDFLRSNFDVRHVKFLPYSNLIVPLAAFFSIDPSRSVTHTQKVMLARWFWRSCLSHRYSGNPQRNIKSDIEQAVRLRKGEKSTMDEFSFDVDDSYFLDNAFSLRTVATKTLILLLASLKPKSFLSGESISLDDVLAEPNRREFHHCYPRSYLQDQYGASTVNALANIALISRSENREISNKPPSGYRSLMAENIDDVKARALLPDSLFDDDYDQFLDERASLLAELALRKARGE